MENFCKILLKSALGSAVAAGSFASAYAQQSAPAAAATPDVPAVAEVVVTAQRRAEALQNVPISMTVASGQQLERAGIRELQDIALIAPSVQLSRTGIFFQPAIRGVTTALTGSNENNVAVYLDGVYIPSTRGLNMDLVSISQVEVLKGPQGTLFGRNATGGAILVNTLDPSPSARSGRVTATYARFNDRQVQGYFSTPLTDSLAANLAASYRRGDGYIKDVAGFNTAPLTQYDITGKLLWQPTDDFSVLAKLETLRNSDGRALAITYEGRSLAKALFPNTTLATADNTTSLNHSVQNDVYQHNASVKVQYKLPWATLASLTSYRLERDKLSFDLDGTPEVLYDQFVADRSQTVQEDLNLTSAPGGPLTYVAGLYYFQLDRQTPVDFAISFSPTYLPQPTSADKRRAYAAYGDVTWNLAPHLFVSAGLRYSHETDELRSWEKSGYVDVGPLAFQGKVDFSSATPRAVVRYELDPSSNVYASYSKGFKSGFIDASPPYHTVQPEKIDAYELGYKTARRRFRLDAAAYYYDYRDLQVSSEVIVNGFERPITTNAAQARIYGVEGQLTANVTEALEVSAGLAYTHARYTSFPNAPVSLPSGPLGLNSSTCSNPNPPPATQACVEDWSGRRMLRAPDWTGNVRANYTILSAIGPFTLSGVTSYSSTYAPTVDNRALSGDGYRYDQPAYWQVNLQASWSPAAARNWSFTAFGTNVTNARVYTYRLGNAFGDYHVLGAPATWGVRVDGSF